MRLKGTELVLLDKNPVKPVEDMIYLAYYKPRGIVCTFEKKRSIILKPYFPILSVLRMREGLTESQKDF